MKKHKDSQWLNYLGVAGGALSGLAREERLRRRVKRAAQKKSVKPDAKLIRQ